MTMPDDILHRAQQPIRVHVTPPKNDPAWFAAFTLACGDCRTVPHEAELKVAHKSAFLSTKMIGRHVANHDV